MKSTQVDYERYDRLIQFDEDYDKYDLRSISDTIEARINAKAYKVMDPISVYNLSRDVYEFGYINTTIEQSDPNVYKDLKHNLAELAARSEMAAQPDKFKYLSRASELGQGEILSRNIRHYEEMLGGDSDSIEYVSRILDDASKNFAKNLGVSQELSDYAKSEANDFERRLEKAEHDWYDDYVAESVDDGDVEDVINSVLESNNESVEYTFHEDRLPAYISKEMTDRGLTEDQIEKYFQDKRVATIDKFLSHDFNFDIYANDPFSTISDDVKSDIYNRYHLNESDLREYIEAKIPSDGKSELRKSFEAKLSKLQGSASDHGSEGAVFSKQ